MLLFILGFSTVFTLLGGFAGTALSSWLRSDAGQRAAGLFVAAFGLFMLLYAFRTQLPWLYREERPLLSRVRPGPAGVFPLGMAFAVGWTPCIGPVLGAILTLAAAEKPGRASLLLFIYSLGLGIPFLLIGAGMTKLLGAPRFFTRHYRAFAATERRAAADDGHPADLRAVDAHALPGAQRGQPLHAADLGAFSSP